MISPFFGGVFRLTSTYGPRFSREGTEFHAGIDCVGISSKRICAVSPGTVVVSQIVADKNDPTWEWGNYVAVLGDDGLIAYYCHMSARSVSVGRRVAIGDELGIEGSTGYTFGAHLHLEIRKNNIPVNAAEYIGVPNVTGVYDANTFASPDNIPAEWSREAFEWATSNGILRGDANGDYALRSYCTREQAIVFLYRTYNLIVG